MEQDSPPPPHPALPFSLGLPLKPKQRANPARTDRKERVLSNGATHSAPHIQVQHKMAAKNSKPSTAEATKVQSKGETPCLQCTLEHGHNEVCDHCMERYGTI